MATITGLYKEDGVAKSGALVSCYNYNLNDISNLTALVDSTTTIGDGTWSLTTPNTNQYLIKIVSPSDIKKGSVYLENAV